MPIPRSGRCTPPGGVLVSLLWCAVLTGCSSALLPFASPPRIFTVVNEQAVPGLTGDQRFAAWSPDGKRLALMSNAAGNWDVWTVGIDGTGPQQLTHEPSSEYTSTWSPDGKWLVFSSDRLHRVWPNLWLLDLQQQGLPEQLSPGDGKYFFPTWSPDGTRIAFLYLSTGPPDLELRVMTVADRRTRILDTRGIIFSPPAWSPDGRTVAFASDRTGNTELWLLDLSRDIDFNGHPPAAALRRLTRHAAIDQDPTWSPDGRRIAFTSSRSGNEEIWVMDITAIDKLAPNTEPPLQQLTHHPAIDHHPQWSPDGKRIVFISTRSGRSAPWLIELTP